MTTRSENVASVNPGLALCNTLRPGRDDMTTVEALAHWYVSVGLADDPPVVTPADLRAARALREGLRAALPAGDTAALAALADAWLTGAKGCLCVDGDTLQPRFTPGETTPRCLMVPAVLAALALAREHPGRVKTCASESCGALFLDTTRNRSRRWCSMEVCGARAKASAYYRRHRCAGGEAAGPPPA